MSTWGRSNPEIQTDIPTDAPDELRLERVGGGARPIGWRSAAVASALIVAVGVLWAKPWSNLVGPPPTPPATLVAEVHTPSPAPTAEPTPDPIVLAVERRQCQSPTDWRMVTAETSATRATRTMYAAVPQSLSGPDVTSVPISHLYASTLRAVGVCVPRSDNGQIAAELRRVFLWQVDRAGNAVPVTDAVVTDWSLYAVGEAYWAPPRSEGATWPAGTYMFEIDPMDGGTPQWMGVQFVPTGPTAARQP